MALYICIGRPRTRVRAAGSFQGLKSWLKKRGHLQLRRGYSVRRPPSSRHLPISVVLTSFSLVTIELLYHAIVILSCRAPSATRSPAQVTPRESLSSHAITTIIAEFRDKLPRLTFVPYAASLALRTTYRELRASTVPTMRARSFKQLRDNCRMLRRFEEMYRPASIMVGLVDRLTKEVDRASNNPARSEPATGTGTPLHPSQPAGVGVSERNSTSGGAAQQDVHTIPALDAMPTEDLSRLDVFESLNFDLDFDALDAAFGDYTYPGSSEFI